MRRWWNRFWRVGFILMSFPKAHKTAFVDSSSKRTSQPSFEEYNCNSLRGRKTGTFSKRSIDRQHNTYNISTRASLSRLKEALCSIAWQHVASISCLPQKQQGCVMKPPPCGVQQVSCERKQVLNKSVVVTDAERSISSSSNIIIGGLT